MSKEIFEPSRDFAANAHADKETYEKMYAASIADPVAFMTEHGKRIAWIGTFSEAKKSLTLTRTLRSNGLKTAL